MASFWCSKYCCFFKGFHTGLMQKGQVAMLHVESSDSDGFVALSFLFFFIFFSPALCRTLAFLKKLVLLILLLKFVFLMN